MKPPKKILNAAPISPQKVNQHVQRLLDLMNAEFEPEIVEVKVEPTAKLASCFYNVAEKIERDGGKIHYGWVVWQHSYLIEAEHHAVWEDMNENLLDITPQKKHFDTIMFIPDNSNIFNGQMAKPNVRLNTTTNKLIDDFIIYASTIDKLYGMATRIDSQNLSLPDQIVNAIQSLEACKQNVFQFYGTGNNYNSRCFCGLMQSYNMCHGLGVRDFQSELIEKAKLVVQNAH